MHLNQNSASPYAPRAGREEKQGKDCRKVLTNAQSIDSDCNYQTYGNVDAGTSRSVPETDNSGRGAQFSWEGLSNNKFSYSKHSPGKVIYN